MCVCVCVQLVTPEQLQKLYRRGLREAESAAGNSYHCKSTNCEGFCFYEDEVNEFHCPICTKVSEAPPPVMPGCRASVLS